MATHTDIVITTSHHVVTAHAGEIDFPEDVMEGKYLKDNMKEMKNSGCFC